jgi:hypothetical protein
MDPEEATHWMGASEAMRVLAYTQESYWALRGGCPGNVSGRVYYLPECNATAA